MTARRSGGKTRGAPVRAERSEIDRFPTMPTAAERMRELRGSSDPCRRDLADALETIEWMSGSGDFAPRGRAHRGWLVTAAPLLELYGFRAPSRKRAG